MPTSLKNTVLRSILNYYVALKLSAGAVADIDWPILDDGPAPIVRRYIQPGKAHWDPREILMLDGKAAVVTVPIRPGVVTGYSAMRLN